MALSVVGAAEAKRLLDLGALLVDIREEDDRAFSHIPGSLHAPLSELPRRIGGCGVPAIIFYCDTGLETAVQGERLARVAASPAFVLQGGLQGWRRSAEAGNVVRSTPLDLRRQFLLTLALILLVLTTLGTLVSPYFIIGDIALGGALTLAGLTGHCRLLDILRWMPWNRSAFARA